jgi:ethanolamine utilization cobalamin adenosyltransferase
MKTRDKKPEYMTSLSGAHLVPKTHRRITFRGIIDTLEAEVIEAQVLASQLGENEICGNLGEILDFLRALMAAEVKETPFPPPFLFGMDAEEIHRRIRNQEWKALPFPAYTQGPLAARLNTLRAKVREAELFAVRVFGPEGTGESVQDSGDTNPREDIILALNRLSSAFWWLFCEFVSGKEASQN